jgi:hypothetical protein
MSDSPDTIAYGRLMHHAMRGLIQTVLSDVARDGLPGDHHFFITFDTQQDGVDIAPWLQERYPEEMTIVIQHWYDGLDVTDDGFSITLNFGDSPERLSVPFDAILTFVDPSVEFGLRFETAPAPDGPSGGDDPIPIRSPADEEPSRRKPPPSQRMPRSSASTRSAANTEIRTDAALRRANSAKTSVRSRPPRIRSFEGHMSQSDFALFMGQLARKPHQVVALAPSSRFLCAEMVAELDPDGGPVIELGAGTGNITRAILGRGIAPENLHSIEMNPEFCDRLRARFPGLTRRHATAYRRDET